MLRHYTAARRTILLAIVTLTVAACGTATPPAATSLSPVPSVATASPSLLPTAAPSSSVPPTPQPSPSTTPAATPAPTATTFDSPFYRYVITLPPGTTILNWRAAVRPWDGTAKLDMAGPFTDRTATAQGGFFLFGAEAESLESWFERVEGNGSRYHGCTPAQNRADVTINDVPAVAFTQSCALDTHMARVALWKDGYGIGVWLGQTPASALVATRDRAIELLEGLEWVFD